MSCPPSAATVAGERRYAVWAPCGSPGAFGGGGRGRVSWSSRPVGARLRPGDGRRSALRRKSARHRPPPPGTAPSRRPRHPRHRDIRHARPAQSSRAVVTPRHCRREARIGGWNHRGTRRDPSPRSSHVEPHQRSRPRLPGPCRRRARPRAAAHRGPRRRGAVHRGRGRRSHRHHRRHQPVVAAVAGAVGNLICVTIVVLATSRCAHRRHHPTRGAPEKPVTARRQKFERAYHRYGTPGVSLLGPLLLPTQFTAAASPRPESPRRA